MALVQPVASRQRNFLLLGLRCNQATPCVGALTVRDLGAAGNAVALAASVAGRSDARIVALAKRRKKPPIYAKARFNIPAGAALDVRARLTAKGKRAVKRKKPMYVAVKMAGGTETSIGGITVAP